MERCEGRLVKFMPKIHSKVWYITLVVSGFNTFHDLIKTFTLFENRICWVDFAYQPFDMYHKSWEVNGYFAECLFLVQIDYVNVIWQTEQKLMKTHRANLVHDCVGVIELYDRNLFDKHWLKNAKLSQFYVLVSVM